MTGQQAIQWLEHMSKTLMYNFHYEHMKVKYPGERLKLLMFTDTDSLCYAVKTQDIYKDMEEHEDNLE